MTVIVQASDPITLLGGGALLERDVRAAQIHAPRLVAADGGANQAMAAGWVPEAVIGDFDSVSSEIQDKLGLERLFHIAEQDSTDFDKCLRSISAPLILGLGFTGRRIDHSLAAFNTLVRRAHQRCLLIAEQEVIFVAPPQMTLPLPSGSAFSLFPMGAVTGQSTGLIWPIDGIAMAPDQRVGTSNRVGPEGRVRLVMDAPRMLVFLPRDALDAALVALRAAPEHWPDHQSEQSPAQSPDQ